MIEDDKVRLRAIERSDLECWRAWVNDSEVAAFVDRILPVTAPEHETFFEKAVLGNSSAVWFGLEERSSKQYIGNVWLWNIDQRHRKAEVRILIGDRGYWSGGFGTSALRLISNFAFEQVGLHKLYAYVMARNPRAKAAFQKAGFHDEADLVDEAFWEGSFHNVWRLYRLRPSRSELND